MEPHPCTDRNLNSIIANYHHLYIVFVAKFTGKLIMFLSFFQYLGMAYLCVHIHHRPYGTLCYNASVSNTGIA